FESNKVEMKDLGNVADLLPITDNSGKDVHFMIAPPDDPMIALLKSYYPGGTTTVLSKPDGKQVVVAYKVRAEDIDSKRMMSARYGMPDGAMYERPEPRLGTIDTSQGSNPV